MSISTKHKNQLRIRRAKRVRARIHGTAAKPRLSVFRSLKHLSAQLINDDLGKTLASVSDYELKGSKAKPLEKAAELGKLLAAKAQKANVKQAVFDRGALRYHGRVKALAEAARENGLEF